MIFYKDAENEKSTEKKVDKEAAPKEEELVNVEPVLPAVHVEESVKEVQKEPEKEVHDYILKPLQTCLAFIALNISPTFQMVRVCVLSCSKF